MGSLSVIENVSLIQKVGYSVQMTLKTMEIKKKLLKEGMPFGSGKIMFRDPAVRVFSATLVDCPPANRIDDLAKLMAGFGRLHQAYEVTRTMTVENVSFQNGNRVFQFLELTELPPKRFTIDGHRVRLVYSDPDPAILSEALKQRLMDWGESEDPLAGWIIPESDLDHLEVVEEGSYERPTQQDLIRQDQEEGYDDDDGDDDESVLAPSNPQQQQQQQQEEQMEVIPETQESGIGKKRSVEDGKGVERKKQHMDSLPITTTPNNNTESTRCLRP